MIVNLNNGCGHSNGVCERCFANSWGVFLKTKKEWFKILGDIKHKIFSFWNILLLKVRTSLLCLQKSGLSKQFLLFVQTPKYFLFVALLIILFFWARQVNWRNIDSHRRDMHVCFLLFFLKDYFPWTFSSHIKFSIQGINNSMLLLWLGVLINKNLNFFYKLSRYEGQNWIQTEWRASVSTTFL